MSTYFCTNLLFFSLVLLFTSLELEARDSKFFSKVTHYSTINYNLGDLTSSPIGSPTLTPAPAPAPVSAPTPAPSPSPVYISKTGDFGPGSGLVVPTTKENTPTTTTTHDEDQLLDDELDSLSNDKSYQTTNYNNNEYTSNSYNNGYKLASDSHETVNSYYNTNYNSGYKLASDSHDTSNSYSNTNYNSGYTSNYNSNNNNYGYESIDRQGMSDTRFVEGGKYYYDMSNEQNVDQVPTNGYYESNTQYPNEFNTMDEYEKQEMYNGRQKASMP